MKKYLLLASLFLSDSLSANCKCSGVPKVTIPISQQSNPVQKPTEQPVPPEPPHVPEIDEYPPSPVIQEPIHEIEIPDFSQMPDEQTEEISKSGVRKVALMLGGVAATVLVLAGSMQSSAHYNLSERVQSLFDRVRTFQSDVDAEVGTAN